MRLDLLDLVRADESKRAEIESYGLDPSKVEEWLQDRLPTHNDPTAAEALWNVEQWEKQKRRRARTRR